MIQYDTDSFDTVMTNSAVSYVRLWSSCTNCTNRIVMHLRQFSMFSV